MACQKIVRTEEGGLAAALLSMLRDLS